MKKLLFLLLLLPKLVYADGYQIPKYDIFSLEPSEKNNVFRVQENFKDLYSKLNLMVKTYGDQNIGGNKTFTGTNTFSGTTKIKGITNSSNADSGNYSEYVSSTIIRLTGPQLVGNNIFFNIATITLTPGDWDVTANIGIVPNGGVYTQIQGVISIYSANTLTDHVSGDNMINIFNQDNSADAMGAIAPYRMNLTTTTTVYLKAACYSTVASAYAYGKIQARRMR